MANYKLDNFLATPTASDTRMRIYDKNSKLKYTLDPHISYFYKKANIVIIKVDNRNDIFLDFSTSTESSQALAKLNDAKKLLTQPDCPVPREGLSVYSSANLNMSGETTVNDGDLACNKSIIDVPLRESYVRVFVNGMEVNTGNSGTTAYPADCFFASPLTPSEPRLIGDERIGDKLYWNPSIAGYNLDEIDLIDFIYLIDAGA